MILEAAKELHRDQSGATATEYVILLILIACFILAIVNLFGETVSEKFRDAETAVGREVNF